MIVHTFTFKSISFSALISLLQLDYLKGLFSIFHGSVYISHCLPLNARDGHSQSISQRAYREMKVLKPNTEKVIFPLNVSVIWRYE
jgi:hypothetical protein